MHVAEPVVLGRTCACEVPAEHDRLKYGFVRPGLGSIRRQAHVVDFYTKQMDRILQCLGLLNTPECLSLLEYHARLLSCQPEQVTD